MWIVKAKTNDRFNTEEFEVATEREAFEYCREMGHNYYYEFVSTKDYMKRKAKQWKQQEKNTQ